MKGYARRNAKRLGKLLAVLLAFLAALNAVWSALSFKYGDGIMDLKYFYQEEDNSIDLLVMGSSHAFENINTGVLYDSYGIAAYVLAGSVQPYWSTYFYLIEALKTQSPKLIVLDAYASAFGSDYSDHSRIIKNTLGIRDWALRYRALQVAAPRESFYDYLFDYRLWHSRYTELGASDFADYYQQPHWKYYKGLGMNFSTKTFERPEVDEVDSVLPLRKKSETYLRKIIELCQQEDIPLLLVKSPQVLSENEKKQYNMTGQIAQEYGVPFVDFNSSRYYDEMGLDFSKDYADAGHLNYRGNVKYTNALAEEILSRYELPDRRGEAGYESWEMHSKNTLARMDNQSLRGEADIPEYFRRLNRDRYLTVMLTVTNSGDILAAGRETLDAWGIDADTVRDGSLYVVRNGALEDSAGEICWQRTIPMGSHLLSVAQSAERTVTHSLSWDGSARFKGESGCYILVYDTSTEELVGISHLTWSNGAVSRETV